MLEVVHNLEKIGNLPQRRQESSRERKFAFFINMIRTIFVEFHAMYERVCKEDLMSQNKGNHHHEKRSIIEDRF
jgi:hypothetical protein